jgi:hypothetical protein
MAGSLGINNAGFGQLNTAQLGNTQFGIQQGLERHYAGMSAIGNLAMNNPQAFENPQVMEKLQQADKQAMLKLEQDKILASVYEKLNEEQKRLQASKKSDPHNSRAMLA